MSLITRAAAIAAGSRRRLQYLAFAVVGAFGVMGLTPAQAHAAPGLCVAGATTAAGKVLPSTRARADRPRIKRACRVALNKCQYKLDDLRSRARFQFPLARCEVLRREVRHVHYGRDNFKCVAKAFTRRGKLISNTRAAETRRVKRRACRIALNRCEAKLDRKRFNTGRGFPHARCEVTRTNRINVRF